MKTFLFIIPLILLGCLSGNNKPIPISYLSTPSVNYMALEYIDSTVFDKSLSHAMNQASAEIEVSILTPFSSNNMPKRLDAWLTVIKENGGDVKTEPVMSERNIIGIALALYSAYQLIEKQFRYLPAKYYNATLFYRRTGGRDALIEKIVFTHKSFSN